MIRIILKYMISAISLIFPLFRLARSAYIDPNTGGMLFQMLAVAFGVLSGLILFFSSIIKKGFYRFMRFLRGLIPGKDMDVSS
jgi:uncharacterized YccA/Bax inhibitor family protein